MRNHKQLYITITQTRIVTFVLGRGSGEQDDVLSVDNTFAAQIECEAAVRVLAHKQLEHVGNNTRTKPLANSLQ
jgi:hypothetical protein